MLTACSNDDHNVVVDEQENAVLTLSAPESRAAEQMQDFNEEFFKAVVASNPQQGNVVCSPLSASVLLSMVANAAEGEVSSQITKALHCSDLEALNSLSKKYLTVLPSVDKDVTLTSANAVWYDDIFKINSKFAKVSENYYSAPTYGRDFQANAPAVVKEINAWCKDKTNGIIDNMIQQLNQDAASVLANAVYFKGNWAIPFDKAYTEKMDFNGASGVSQVDMMYKSTTQHYAHTADYQAVKMQIGAGKFEAVFVLPETDVDAFIAGADFGEIVSEHYFDYAIDYYLPRFKYTPPFEPMNLNGAFAQLGITLLNEFTPLTMFDNDIEARHTIVHKAGVEFTEEGAEGASVTMDVLYTSSGMEVGPTIVKFDRPFVFIIRETTTGAMLFAGKISDL